MDIGILSLTRFGDLVQTSPITSGLRRRHPGARIHLIVKRRFRSAAEMLPGVDVVHEIDGDALAQALTDPATPFVRAYEMVRDVVEELRAIPFDWLFNLTHSRGSAVLLSLLQARRTTGFTLDRAGKRRVDDCWLIHMGTLVRARRLMRVNLVDGYLGAAGLLGKGERLGVHISAEAGASAASLLPGGGPYLAVQLGASQDAKTWPVERYASTLQALATRRPDVTCVLVGVAGEAARAARLAQLCPKVRTVSLVGRTSIAELGAALMRCKLLLTGDTGTMHLAAAVGTRTCTVFVGLGNPYETAAYGEGHVALLSRLACAPCSHLVHCGRPVCHEDVPADWLADLLAQMLADGPLDALPPLPRADLLRTRFDETGMLELVPIHSRAPDPHELLRLAYHPIFLEGLSGVPARLAPIRGRAQEQFGVDAQSWSHHLPAELPVELASLITLGDRGAAEASALAEAFRAGPGDSKRAADLVRYARRVGDTLAELDAEIYRIGRGSPLLKPLCLSLEGEAESLPDTDVRVASCAAAGNYATLARRARLLRSLVLGTNAPLCESGDDSAVLGESSVGTPTQYDAARAARASGGMQGSRLRARELSTATDASAEGRSA